MIAPFTWWANRKSKMGMKPSAKAPPHLPGKPWWTNPPTTIPQPEHIEYVAQFAARLWLEPCSDERNAMMQHISAWMRAARRVLHEESYSTDRADLHTTDGLLIAADDALRECILVCHKAGIRLDARIIEVNHELQRRNAKSRRERAVEAAKRSNGVNR